jgi:hypothetical protein
VLLALHGHPSLQQLSHASTSISEAYWQQQPLRSMPQLRQLDLSGINVEVLGALLEDASGCAQLQELQLHVACEDADPAPGSSWTAQGLAALASGPCRHSLRSIKIRVVCDLDAQHVAQHVATPAQLAQLLLPGALPQLQELQLDVRVHVASLLPRRSARLQQARAGAAAIPQPPQQRLPGTPEQHLQLMVCGLLQAGVQGLGGFRLAGESGWIGSNVCRWGFEGRVGPCRFSGRLWVVR